MRTMMFFKTDAGLARLRRFIGSFGLPAPAVFPDTRIVLLGGMHRLQLNALRLGWKNLRAARAELKEINV